MKWQEWDTEIETMTEAELRDRLAALETLAAWPALKREFWSTGLLSLRYGIQARLERQENLDVYIAEFPETFRLRRRGSNPDDLHRISKWASFVGSDGTVWLVIQRKATEDYPDHQIKAGDWVDLCRCTPSELRNNIYLTESDCA